MLVFGIESSIFDYLTFAILIWFFHASSDVFRTGWFVESVVTEVLILLIVRTRRTFFSSRPGKFLFISSIGVIGIVIVITIVKIPSSLGFSTLPMFIIGSMCLIALIYGLLAEVTKKIIFRQINY